MAGRSLTHHEQALAEQIFRSSIDYAGVRIHARRYVFFQRPGSGMAPNGEIYVHGAVVSEDYALDRPELRSFFIHEMAHVWQQQNGVLRPIWSAIGNSLRHGLRYSRAYRYVLAPTADLLDYRMEQQAQIIEDFFRIHALAIAPRAARLRNRECGRDLDALFASVLENFLEDPSYAKRR